MLLAQCDVDAVARHELVLDVEEEADVLVLEVLEVVEDVVEDVVEVEVVVVEYANEAT